MPGTLNAFTYHGVRHFDGENAEGIPELAQNISIRLRALEQRAAAQGMYLHLVILFQHAAEMDIGAATTPETSKTSNGDAGSAETQPMNPSAEVPPNSQAQPNFALPVGVNLTLCDSNANADREQAIIPHPDPERCPSPIRQRETDNRGSQIQQPPYSAPGHAVFLYWGRDLSGNVLLPRFLD
jgi:hypothetical protein